MSHGPRTPGKPTVPEIAPKVAAIYARHSAGCCLHIVLDDGNVKDDNVRFCLDEAGRNGHPDCAELAQILLTMSKTQRLKLRDAAHKLERERERAGVPQSFVSPGNAWLTPGHQPVRVAGTNVHLDPTDPKKSPDVFTNNEEISLSLRGLMSESMEGRFPPGGTVELVDEEDEHGLVVFKAKDGTPQMYMPRWVYEKFRAAGAEGKSVDELLAENQYVPTPPKKETP